MTPVDQPAMFSLFDALVTPTVISDEPGQARGRGRPTLRPDNWPYHGSDTGYRYGCRCSRCKRAHQAAAVKSAASAGAERTCARCGKSYVWIMNSGNGTKYCADCKEFAYREAVDRHYYAGRPTVRCPGCGVDCSSDEKHWNLCRSCYGRIPEPFLISLRKHRASAPFVLAVAQNPGCAVCSVDLTLKIKDTNKGRFRYQFALDHDHQCCAGPISCGSCLRGLLCMRCNTALGYLQDDASRARALADYLDLRSVSESRFLRSA